MSAGFSESQYICVRLHSPRANRTPCRINSKNISVRQRQTGLTFAGMSVFHRGPIPSWPPSEAAIHPARIHAPRRLYCSRALARWMAGSSPAMMTGGHTNACRLCAYADFKCASHPHTATSSIVGSGGGPHFSTNKTNNSVSHRPAGVPPLDFRRFEWELLGRRRRSVATLLQLS